MGELLRRPHGRVAPPCVVRPARLAAANDNLSARNSRRRGARRLLAQVALASLVLVLALTVGGCGRRGAPELPASAKNEQRVPLYATEPGGDEVPNRAFIGDKILQ